MNVTSGELLIWLAVAGTALVAIGVLAEYVAAALHHRHKKGHQ